MKYIRIVLGQIILFFDAISRPKPIKRSEDAQKQVDVRTDHLSLYQFHACPFCVKVRREMHRLNLNVDLRDAKTDQIGEELLKEGGKRKVPCLRIDENNQTQWLYDSKAIVEYLQNEYEKV